MTNGAIRVSPTCVCPPPGDLSFWEAQHGSDQPLRGSQFWAADGGSGSGAADHLNDWAASKASSKATFENGATGHFLSLDRVGFPGVPRGRLTKAESNLRSAQQTRLGQHVAQMVVAHVRARCRRRPAASRVLGMAPSRALRSSALLGARRRLFRAAIWGRLVAQHRNGGGHSDRWLC